MCIIQPFSEECSFVTETGSFWVGEKYDGVPRPSCKQTPENDSGQGPGSPAHARCNTLDVDCPQMVITSARNATVLRTWCELTAGYMCDLGPMVVIPGFCQVQGLLTSFLSPLVLCYLMLISIERFLQYLVPEEHDLTFSWLNTNVIQVGVMFLLVTDATGPVYGWAQYVFSPESGLCILDAGSRHVTTYISVSLPLYYFLPFLVTLVSHALVLFQRHTYHEEDEYPSPSRVIPSGRRGQLLLFLSCLLPFLGRFPSVLAMVMCAALFSNEESEQDSVDDTLNKICREGHLEFELVWLKFFSITCLPPIMLLLGCSSLRRQARKSISRFLRRCRRTPRDNREVSIELRPRTSLRCNRRLNPNPCILPPPRDPMCSRDIRRVRTRSPEDEIIELV